MYAWARDSGLAHSSNLSAAIAQSRQTKRLLHARAVSGRSIGKLPDLNDAPLDTLVSVDAAAVMDSEESFAELQRYTRDALSAGFQPVGVASGTRSRFILARAVEEFPVITETNSIGDTKPNCGSDDVVLSESSGESITFVSGYKDVAKARYDPDQASLRFSWQEQAPGEGGYKVSSGVIDVVFKVRRTNDTVSIMPQEVAAELDGGDPFLRAVKVQFLLEHEVDGKWVPVRLRCSRSDFGICVPEALCTVTTRRRLGVILGNRFFGPFQDGLAKAADAWKGVTAQIPISDVKFSGLDPASLFAGTYVLDPGATIVTSHLRQGSNIAKDGGGRRLGRTMRLARELHSVGVVLDDEYGSLSVMEERLGSVQKPLVFYADKPPGQLAVSVLASVEMVPLATDSSKPVKIMENSIKPAPAGQARLVLEDEADRHEPQVCVQGSADGSVGDM